MSRLLTNQEIENILDFMTPQRGIPIESATSINELNKERFRKQLVGQSIYPEIIPQLKETLYRTWNKSLVQPGECVGVICAQSIGEKNTQTALNTFHKAGQSEKTMTEGVPRFQELLNATKKPKMVNHKIFFKQGSSTIKELRNVVGHTVTGMTLGDITNSFTIKLDKTQEAWYPASRIIYGNAFDAYQHCVRVQLNMKKLFEYSLTEQDVATAVHEKYSDISCVFSPFGDGVMDIFVDTSDVLGKMSDGPVAYINEDNATEIYLEDVVQPNLEKLQVCGIAGVNEIFYVSENDEWIVETNTVSEDPSKINNLNKIMSLPYVDMSRTVSNNIWEIYETLGVEATKRFLVEEFMSIMDGINECHAKLLVDRMTFGGSIASISRYTLKNDECGPMGKASFEESLDNFLNAAANGEVEPTRGISASIICGKRSNTGTGMMGLRMKLT
jgi:DNA-directed RNA polymerase beta' subunit